MGLSGSSTTSTVWSLASLVGALCGGVLADWAARYRKGGRILVQSLGLILGAPFVFLAGWSASFSMLIAALVGARACARESTTPTSSPRSSTSSGPRIEERRRG